MGYLFSFMRMYSVIINLTCFAKSLWFWLAISWIFSASDLSNLIVLIMVSGLVFVIFAISFGCILLYHTKILGICKVYLEILCNTVYSL